MTEPLLSKQHRALDATGFEPQFVGEKHFARTSNAHEMSKAGASQVFTSASKPSVQGHRLLSRSLVCRNRIDEQIWSAAITARRGLMRAR
jgi:hypothetical protein